MLIKDIQVGSILRIDSDRFADCIVRKIEGDTIHLERPYAFVNGADTTCPTVLLGTERFSIVESSLKNMQLVGTHLALV